MKWLLPEYKFRNINLSIDKAFLGKSVFKIGKDENENKNESLYYSIEPLQISYNTYQDIVNNICKVTNIKSKFSFSNDNNNDNNTIKYNYLHISKLTNHIVKSDIKYFITFSQSICPDCKFVNCVLCSNQNQFKRYMRNYRDLTQTNRKHYPLYITCYQCKITFKPNIELLSQVFPYISSTTDNNNDSQSTSKILNFICHKINERKKFFKSFNNWQCQLCKDKFEHSYIEFLSYLEQLNISAVNIINDNTNFLFKTSKALFDRLNKESQLELKNDSANLGYSLCVKLSNNNFRIVPPFSFLMDYQRTFQFYNRLISDPSISLFNIKTSYGSVSGRMRKGKYAFIRQHGHNKRYVGSARLVITPCYSIEPDECILPINVWRRLDCPRYILAHRYPTLDDRNFTLHRIAFVWIYPVMAIPTSIVHGNHADFDGDAMQVIPMSNNLASEIEAITLFHPSNNMIIQDGLRVSFDHDEILTLYYLYGFKRKEIHDALYYMAKNKSSIEAYNIFIQLRKVCHFIWHNQMVFTISYKDLLEFIDLDKSISYIDFIEKKFPKVTDFNTIKEMILSQSSRFSKDHLWQIVGQINEQARTSFLQGMNRQSFINMAMLSRDASNKDIAYHGYTYIKLLYCTCNIVYGYDGRIYTSDGILVADHIEDIL